MARAYLSMRALSPLARVDYGQDVSGRPARPLQNAASRAYGVARTVIA
jgi:hypothetical protein